MHEMVTLWNAGSSEFGPYKLTKVNRILKIGISTINIFPVSSRNNVSIVYSKLLLINSATPRHLQLCELKIHSNHYSARIISCFFFRKTSILKKIY